MTNSAITAMPLVAQTASQNNSNNKEACEGGLVKDDEAFTPDVDDSPINSPELLPTNSVSYHQVKG